MACLGYKTESENDHPETEVEQVSFNNSIGAPRRAISTISARYTRGF